MKSDYFIAKNFYSSELSPGEIPASIIDSPFALSKKKVPLPNIEADNDTYSSIYSSSSVGTPQETAPSSATLVNSV